MFILFKLGYAKFGVSNLFLSKIMEKKLLEEGRERGGGGTNVNSVRARILKAPR